MGENGSAQIGVLGPVTVLIGGSAAVLAGGKQRDLLAVLTINAGRPVPVDRLIAQLWGDDPPATVNAALQVHVSGLRKVLGERVQWTPAGYVLDIDGDDIDAVRFDSAIARARAATNRRDIASAYLEGFALWRGDPYSGVGDVPAVAAERHRLWETRLAAAEEYFELELARGRHAAIVEQVGALARQAPARERLVGQYMLALHRCGRVADAGEAYLALRRALKDEVDAEPGEVVTALARAIKLRDPTLDVTPESVPVPSSRFVGRRWELDHLAERMSANRLLTLVGPGGAGKTRLALQLAREVGASHPDGTYFVDLGEADGPDSALSRVAAALRVRQRGGETTIDTTISSVVLDRALLVLDNCEHVVDPIRFLATTMLRRSGALRILATSRVPLGVDGEVIWPVYGLAVPAEGAPREAVARADAVRLLAERGAAVRPGFRIDESNVDVAAAVCRRVDGLPLAIEMIAPRLRGMSIEELEKRLVSRLDLLGVAPGISRHRTIRAAVDWSHSLLTAEEQALLRRLSVFAGGWTVDAAEQVASGPPVPREATLDLLLRLVDQSMVVATTAPESTRYAMLETIQEYATEHLAESADLEQTRRRHAAWACEIAQVAADLGGDAHRDALMRLRAEHDNIRAALAWSVGEGAEPEMALTIASRMWWYWWLIGDIAEGRAWLDRALAGAPPDWSRPRIEAVDAAASLARTAHDLPAARRFGEQLLAAQREVGNDAGIARALNGLCMTANAQDDLAASMAYATESLALATRAQDGRAAAAANSNLGVTLRALGRLDEAWTHLSDSVRGFEALHDRRGAAAALRDLAAVARRRGDLTTARQLSLRSLSLYRDLELVEGQVDALEALACVESADGRAALAVRLLTVAKRVRRDLGVVAASADEQAQCAAAWSASSSVLSPQEVLAAEAAALAENLDDVAAEALS